MIMIEPTANNKHKQTFLETLYAYKALLVKEKYVLYLLVKFKKSIRLEKR